MKQDVINGYVHLIFSEDELEAARQQEQDHPFSQGGPTVRIATRCNYCDGYVETSREHFDNRANDPIVHAMGNHRWD